MQRKQNRRRIPPSIFPEAMEPRLLFAYGQMTQMTGVTNPFNGVDAGAFSAPALGDVDGDGDLDALVMGNSGAPSYYKNIGSAILPNYLLQIGANNPFSVVGTASLPAVALGDVDGDNDLDLILGENGSALLYYKNTGSATNPAYTQQTGAANPFNAISVGSRPAAALGDVDGDGDLDLAVGWLGGNVHYFKNAGSAISPVYVQQTGAANPLSGFSVDFYSTPAFGDADGDGDLDAAVGGQSSMLYLKNTGTASSPIYALQTGAASPLNGTDGTDFSTPALGDLDGDGDIDAFVGKSDGTLRDFRGGVVPPAVAVNLLNIFPTVEQDSVPAPGDVDADGDLDFFVGAGDGTLRYYRNTGSAVSPVYVEQTGAANPFNGIDIGFSSAPALGDVDGDGDLDAVVGENNGTLLYFRNTGTATSPVYVQQGGGANPLNGFDVGSLSTPTLGDVDGDGDLDLVSGEAGQFGTAVFGMLYYFKNIGTATNPVYSHQTGAANPFNGFNAGDSTGPALGDADGDGDLDLLVGHLLGETRYWRNTGTAASPVYAPQTGGGNPFFNVGLNESHTKPGLGDLDGDGDVDALLGLFSPFGNPTLRDYRANRAPVVDNAILDQTFSGPGAKSYTFSANSFQDLDNNPLTYTAALTSGAALPAWLSFNPLTRQFSGNPRATDVSPIQIRVTANDGRGASGFDEFQLTLTNVIDPPLAVNDSYFVNQDTTLRANGAAGNPLGVLFNDSDPEGAPINAIINTQPAHGALLDFFQNGSFTYRPNTGYFGTDSFTYQSYNGTLLSNAATVSINVVQVVRPSVTQSQFHFETAPQKVTIDFSEDVAPSLSASDFIVTRFSDGALMQPTVTYNQMTNVATLTFSSILADSDYRLRVIGNGITNAAGNTMATDHELDFFFMAGDSTRDRTVDISDFAILASRFNVPGTFSQGDSDYNGVTDLGDFAILASKFNTSLPQSWAAPRAPIVSGRAPSVGFLGATEPRRLFAELNMDEPQGAVRP